MASKWDGHNHTKKRTEQVLKQFNRTCKYNAYDSSWVSDITDSIDINDSISIHIPNSKVLNEYKELFNYFSIVVYDGENCEELTRKFELGNRKFSNATETINFINENL